MTLFETAVLFSGTYVSLALIGAIIHMIYWSGK